MKKLVRIIGIVMLAMFLSFVLTSVIFAAESIADGDTSGIYSGEMFGSSDFLKSILHKISEVLPVLSGFDVAGMTIGTLLVHLADFFYLAFSASGVSLSSIIYGRVGGALEGADNLNLFSFEMVNGNFYGVASMAFYSVIRNVFIVVMMMIIMWNLVAFIYTDGDSRSRARLIEKGKDFVLIVLALLMMPRVLDVALYARDGVLYTVLLSSERITDAFSDALGTIGDGTSVIDSLLSGPKGLFMRFIVPGGAADICYTFRVSAVKLGVGTSFGNCLCYFASVFATILFMAQYVGMALSMCVLIAFFPFACAMNMIYPNILKEWSKNVIGLIIVPVIDAILFCFPVLAAIANSSGKYGMIAFVQLALIYGIMPARGTIRSLLGLGKGTAIELAGLGAMMGIMSFVKKVASVGAEFITGGMGGGKTYSKQFGAFGGGGSAGSAGGFGESAGGAAAMFLDKAKRIDFQSEKQGTSALDEMEKAVNGIPGSADDLKKRRRQLDDIGNSSETSAQKGKQRRTVVEDAVRDIDRRKEEIEENLSANDHRTQKAKRDLARSKDRQAALEAKLAKLQMPKGSFASPDEEEKNEQEKYNLRQKIAEEKMNQSRLGNQIAEGNAFAAQGRQQLDQIKTAQRYGKQAIAGMKAVSGNGVQDDSDILDKYADISNFESPEFKGISYERRAELINERDAAVRRASIGKLVGAGVGGLTAGAGSMFYGIGPSSYMASIGMDVGSQVGGAVGYGMAGEGSAYGAAGGQSYGSSGYDTGTGGGGPAGTGPQSPLNNVYETVTENEVSISQKKNLRITQEPGQMVLENTYDAMEVMGENGVTGITYVPKSENDYESIYTQSPDGNSGITTIRKKPENLQIDVQNDMQSGVQYNVQSDVLNDGGSVVLYQEHISGTDTGYSTEMAGYGGEFYGGGSIGSSGQEWQAKQRAIYEDIHREFAGVFMNQRTQDALLDYSQQAFGSAAVSAQDFVSAESECGNNDNLRERVINKAVDAYSETLGQDVIKLFSSRRVVSGERRLAFNNYIKQFVIKSGLASKVEEDLISKRIVDDTGERIYM